MHRAGGGIVGWPRVRSISEGQWKRLVGRPFSSGGGLSNARTTLWRLRDATTGETRDEQARALSEPAKLALATSFDRVGAEIQLALTQTTAQAVEAIASIQPADQPFFDDVRRRGEPELKRARLALLMALREAVSRLEIRRISQSDCPARQRREIA